jgi:hypothetical protein
MRLALILPQIVAKKPLSEDVRGNLAAHVSCIGGAATEAEWRSFLGDAEFQGNSLQTAPVRIGDSNFRAPAPDVLLFDRKSNLSVYWESDGSAPNSGCCATTPDVTLKPSDLPSDFDVNEWVGE